jgi:enoyl-CoA hydratase/carnithine racemase
MAAAETVQLEREGPVAWVTLHRPEALNALTAAMMDELRATWALLAGDRTLRCVVVTGAGRGFCAGADLSLLASARADVAATAADELSFLPGRWLAVPVVVAVNGPCAGGGLHFVADADVAIAAREASFSDPHVGVGQVSALEPLELVLRMRPDVLRRLVLLGREGALDADAALASGLVSEVVDGEHLHARVDELAAAICQGSPTAVAISRGVLRTFEERLLAAALDDGWRAIRAHWSHPDAREGPAARIEKRAARWQDRMP